MADGTMKDEYEKLLEAARSRSKEIKKYFERLRHKKPRELDGLVSGFHEEIFSEIDCLECANCCRTLGPKFTPRDVDKASAALGLRESSFRKAHLRVDEDGDAVLKALPCPFLCDDNWCSIYDDRPKACREYPHTEERFHSLLLAAEKNVFICPAAYQIYEKLRKALPL